MGEQRTFTIRDKLTPGGHILHLGANFIHRVSHFALGTGPRALTTDNAFRAVLVGSGGHFILSLSSALLTIKLVGSSRHGLCF
jgi:hypothetical protein